MHAAFSVLYEGARGETAEQIRGVFGMAEDDAARHQAVSDAMSSLNRDDPHATLEMANSLWLAEILVPHARYVEVVRGTYAADIETLNSDSIMAADRINGWAAEKTRDKIPEVVKPIDVNGALAVILNAIYFKGMWEVQFDPADTRPRDFDTGNGTVQADMMRVDAAFGYAEYDGTPDPPHALRRRQAFDAGSAAARTRRHGSPGGVAHGRDAGGVAAEHV